MVGGANGTDKQCIFVTIDSGYLAQINFKFSEVYLSCNRTMPGPEAESISVPVY